MPLKVAAYHEKRSSETHGYDFHLFDGEPPQELQGKKLAVVKKLPERFAEKTSPGKIGEISYHVYRGTATTTWYNPKAFSLKNKKGAGAWLEHLSLQHLARIEDVHTISTTSRPSHLRVKQLSRAGIIPEINRDDFVSPLKVRGPFKAPLNEWLAGLRKVIRRRNRK